MCVSFQLLPDGHWALQMFVHRAEVLALRCLLRTCMLLACPGCQRGTRVLHPAAHQLFWSRQISGTRSGRISCVCHGAQSALVDSCNRSTRPCRFLWVCDGACESARYCPALCTADKVILRAIWLLVSQRNAYTTAAASYRITPECSMLQHFQTLHPCKLDSTPEVPAALASVPGQLCQTAKLFQPL